MIGAPLDTMTLLHHAEHLADIPDKRIRRFGTPFATPGGTVWRMTEEYDTCDPVVDGLPADYFGTIVDEFLSTGGAAVGTIGHASAVVVPASGIVRSAVAWLEARLRRG